MKITNNSIKGHTFLTLQYNRIFATRKIYRTPDLVVMSHGNEYNSTKGWCCKKLEVGEIGELGNRKIKHWRIVGMAHGN
jgi:hypothetical protein